MPLVGRKSRSLDGKEVMELWVEMGSLGRVWKFYNTRGDVNPDTGQPFTTSALWRSVAVFTVDHSTEAREYYRKAGAVFTDEQWALHVIRRATQVYRNSRTGFLRWVIGQGWPREYESVYRDEFGIKPEDYDYYAATTRRMPKKSGRQFRDQEVDSEDLPE